MYTKETIYIIGAGAIGTALAAVLQNTGRRVMLVKSNSEVTAENKTVTVLLNDGSEITEHINVTALHQLKHLHGLAVITTKGYGNEKVAHALKAIASAAPIVLLQNGLGVESPFLQEGFTHLYRCVLFATSQFNNEGKAVFKPVTASPVGIIHGNTAELSGIVDALHTAVFPFAATTDIETIIWKKTIANCVFNSVCPLLETDNGIFYRDETALAIAKEMIRECVAIAGLHGIGLSSEAVIESLLQISKASEGQFISTLQDIRNKRPTEIEYLNMAVAKAAANKGKEELVPITRILGELTLLKSLLNHA